MTWVSPFSQSFLFIYQIKLMLKMIVFFLLFHDGWALQFVTKCTKTNKRWISNNVIISRNWEFHLRDRFRYFPIKFHLGTLVY